MQFQSTVLAALAAYVTGAELSATRGDFQQVFANAVNGDTITLEAGEYATSEPIVLDKKLIIKGDGALFVVSDLAAPVFAFGNMEGYSSTLNGLSVGTPGAEACDLAEPYALRANFSIEITGATVANNKVNLQTDVGVWHNERKLNDFYFADCHYAVDHPAKMSGGRGAMGRVHTCSSDEDDLRLAVTHEGNAVTNLLIQIDTVRNVAATINAKYKSADIGAAINLVDVGFFDGWNHSKIRLEIHLPAPFTIINTEGVVGRVEESSESEVSALSSYIVDASCNEQAIGDGCIQNVVFDIIACDLIGEYSLDKLMIACQETDENDNPAKCPNIDSAPATVQFFIDTNSFCEVEEFELDALFDLSIEVYDSEAYDSPETVFDLGSMSYRQITIDTSASGVSLYNAEVIYVKRTTDGDCSSFEGYLGDVSDGNPDFTQTYDPAAQTISMPHQVRAQMACATSDRTGNAITMNYTVLDDYDDGSARRSRSLDGMTSVMRARLR
ncbi:hypothetical protein SARC_07610 [Sphaeroforma arctica JP610]|uniref:Uncharacterized protein n=1 Tax=Sphaeroforma arctica JP610 TaxID=667725 RepID=A0A0L0FTV5_9EUKA|nr:hypothetical protein SARC_07610 [Sphaeroforma arctica JP610]KNC80016.1 hypothetical protein SARC_07610 [Sphaeroforma arctica JP610]|eukprot:XP_014153918.1 hypothetical protein SARC_07610 [Sphaeroforma arctica JP610]